MAPKLLNNNKTKLSIQKYPKYTEIYKKMKEYKKFIKNNFKFVGENFTYEARSIHYDAKKQEKGIYGTASKEQIKELREEGINAEIIPWFDDKKN